MKIPFLTDLHFGARNDDERIMQLQIQFFHEVFFPYCDENDIKVVFNLGDTFDKRKILNIRTDYMFRKRVFDEFERRGIKVVTLIGNHDVYFKNTNDVNSMKSIADSYSHIHVVESFEEHEFGGVRFGMMSWINNENYAKALDFIEKTSADIICGHFEAIGFEMSVGNVSQHGIDASVFKRFDDVFSGHFHTPSRRGNFEYIGNQFDITWTDYGVRKSFMVFDTETRTKEFIHNPYRLFEVVAFNDSIDVVNYDYAQHQGKIVRVVIASFSNENASTFTLFMDSIARHAYKVEVEEMSKIIHGEESEDLTEDESLSIMNGEVSSDTRSIIDKYVSSVSVSGIKNDVLLKMMYELHENSNEKV